MPHAQIPMPDPEDTPPKATLYLAATAVDQLGWAQVEIDIHLPTKFGFCTGCGQLAPCALRAAASAVFARYHRLPRRRPGLALQGAPR
jgi:hypothetical protein